MERFHIFEFSVNESDLYASDVAIAITRAMPNMCRHIHQIVDRENRHFDVIALIDDQTARDWTSLMFDDQVQNILDENNVKFEGDIS